MKSTGKIFILFPIYYKYLEIEQDGDDYHNTSLVDIIYDK